MTTSIFLAKLLGPLFLIACIGYLLHRDQYHRAVTDLLASPSLMLVLGMAEFSLGLTTVIFHNIWTLDWRVLVTLMGWAAMLEGGSMLLAPGLTGRLGKYFLENRIFYLVSLSLGIVIGLIFCYYGYLA